MQSSSKKAVKVSYQGETKRLKLSNNYAELVERTRSAFKNLPPQLKFFYLDEDNEIISISAQSDFSEALENEEFGVLRLTVAQTASDARKQLLTQLEDQRPLAESINMSQVMIQHGSAGFGRPSTFRESLNNGGNIFDDAASQAELARSFIPDQHEVAVGSDKIMHESVSVGCDALPRAHKAEAGSMTARVQTQEKMIDTCVETVEASSQVQAKVRDMGCDGILQQMQNQASQMEVQVKEQDVTCDLLIPSDDEDAVDLEEVTCIKCNGTQMNKKGLPCRKCNGRGTLVSKELSAVASMVRQEVEEFLYTGFRRMFVDYLKDKQTQQDSTKHSGIVCDGCEADPIVGVRYMCSVCSDADFCETCEKTGVHPQHPLLKIRKPKQAPNKLICQYKDAELAQKAFKVEQPQPFTAPRPRQGAWDRNLPRQMPQAQQAQPKSELRYSARFVQESISAKHEMTVGERFTKIWTFRNDGETEWPVGTQLVQVSGDDMKASVFSTTAKVMPGDKVNVSVSMTAPSLEGRYVSFFRLQTGKIKFGHKVDCDVVCVPAKVPVVAADKVIEQPVQMVAQDPVPDAVMDDHVQAAQVPQSELLGKSWINIDAKSPKQIYFDQCDKESDVALKQDLIALYDFGFTNFAINKALMLKHKDVNLVAGQLMEGHLSESQMNAILQ